MPVTPSRRRAVAIRAHPYRARKAEERAPEVPPSPAPRVFAATPSEHLHCPVCCDVFRRPLRAPCGHSFCATCIERWLASAPKPSCPLDRRPLRADRDLHRDFLIENIIAELPARCPNKVPPRPPCTPLRAAAPAATARTPARTQARTHAQGCRWEGTAGGADEHARSCVLSAENIPSWVGEKLRVRARRAPPRPGELKSSRTDAERGDSADSDQRGLQGWGHNGIP